MLVQYWSVRLDDPRLRLDVPGTAQSVFDPVYRGTGNWPFNTAFAGTLPGIDGFVVRLRDLRDVERLIQRQIPAAVSVSLGQLRGRAREGDAGHMVVVRGFDAQGDVWVNDPDATVPRTEKKPVRRLVARDAVERAWSVSRRTASVVLRRGEEPITSSPITER